MKKLFGFSLLQLFLFLLGACAKVQVPDNTSATQTVNSQASSMPETNTQCAVVYPTDMRLEPISVSPDGAVLVQFFGLSDTDGASSVYILR